MKILGVDPSVNNVGLAYWDSNRLFLKTTTFHPKRDSESSISSVAVQVARFIHIDFLAGEGRLDGLVMEFPQFENSDRGHQAMIKGFLFDLAFILGYLGGCLGVKASDIKTPTPNQWKGQMPKKAVGLRFDKTYGLDYEDYSDHEYEAAMMIQWYLNGNI